MEYEKKEMLIYQQGKTITDQFYLDDDYNVPDARSDVGKVILSEGKLKVEELKEVEKRPGIIGYIVQDGDDLWELAKRYSTTMEGIMEVNQMENSDLKSGDKILIFKENMSIL